MKTLIIVAVMVGSGCAGRLPPPAALAAGWVDFARVRAGSALGRMLDDGHAAMAKTRHAEADKTASQLAEAEKRKDKDLAAERAQAQAHVQQLRAEVDQDEAEVQGRLLRAIQPVAAALAKERGLSTADLIPPGRLWSADDLTDEVIRRLDAQPASPTSKP